MSSAMMTRMLGFSCCAAAVETSIVTALSHNRTLAQTFQSMLRNAALASLRVRVALSMRNSTTLGVIDVGAGRPIDGARLLSLVARSSLIAAMASIGRFDLLQDLTKVVALWSLQRRELFVRH